MKEEFAASRYRALRRAVPAVVLGANALFVAVVIAWSWPEWWVNINYERSPLNWFSSAQLLLIAVGASIVFVLSDYLGRPAVRWRSPWLLLGPGFAYLSLDEQFQFHERIRENFLKPHHIGTHLPGIHPSDFVLIAYGVAGLVLAWKLRQDLKEDRPALRWFYWAVGFSAVAVAMDAADVELRTLFLARVSQFTEEIFETLGELSFLTSFGLFALRCFHRLSADEA